MTSSFFICLKVVELIWRIMIDFEIVIAYTNNENKIESEYREVKQCYLNIG